MYELSQFKTLTYTKYGVKGDQTVKGSLYLDEEASVYI